MPESQSDTQVRIDRALRVKFPNRLRSLNRYARRGYVANHKPLMVLVAFGRVAAGSPRLTPFPQIEDLMKRLLFRYGGVEQATASYPFWRLQSDRIWEVEGADGLPARDGNTDPPVSVLRDRRVAAGFLFPYDDLLRRDPAFLRECVTVVMETYFRSLPFEDQKALLMEVGLEPTVARPASAGSIAQGSDA